jgi:predicted component of type VI protein secretion system
MAVPYIILTANGEELDRAELSGPMTTIGRSSDCDVTVRDVLMSRRHCRIERQTGKEAVRWRLVDMGSRNGCHVNWKKVASYSLVDGDVARIGRTWITFHTGPFQPPSPTVAEAAARRKNKLVRPSTPNESLSGTVVDFVLAEAEKETEPFDVAPSPRVTSQRRRAAGGGTCTALAAPFQEVSSSWESLTAVRTAAPRLVARPMPRTIGADLSLQALPADAAPRRRRRHRLLGAALVGIAIWATTLLVLASGWILTQM